MKQSRLFKKMSAEKLIGFEIKKIVAENSVAITTKRHFTKLFCISKKKKKKKKKALAILRPVFHFL